MEVDGTVEVDADPGRAYDALLSPEWMADALPGVRELASEGEGAYRIRWEIGLAMIRAWFAGRIRWTPGERGRSLGLRIEGEGSMGPLALLLDLTLTPRGDRTAIHYRGAGVGPEPEAGLGGRLMEPVVRFMIDRLVEAMARAAGSS